MRFHTPKVWALAAPDVHACAVERSRLGYAEVKAVCTARGPDPVISLFLCGDVMTGRGIDQVLPQSCHPRLYEPVVRDARQYVDLAEAVNGPIPRPISYGYIWGEALQELDGRRPAARVINLETSVTTSSQPWPKGINHRMHPQNVTCLTTAAIDCCVLANNHVLDWDRSGLDETLQTLVSAGIRSAGAGSNADLAAAPAVIPLENGARLLVFAAATGDSGVPSDWAATSERAGVSRLPDLSEKTLQRLAACIDAVRETGDLVLFSVHWGGNWGFDVPQEQRRFARGLIDRAAVDLIHGHSSHHVKGFEIHRSRLILHGCGDFLNDYEGISGHRHYRGELGLMYFPQLERGTGELLGLEMVPTRIRRFRIERATGADRQWLAQTLQRECGRLGTRLETGQEGAIVLIR